MLNPAPPAIHGLPDSAKVRGVYPPFVRLSDAPEVTSPPTGLEAP